MTNDPQHDKKEEEEEQVQFPEEVKLFELEKMEEEQARKRKDVKQNIDTELRPGSRPPPETETGNSVNGSVLSCDLGLYRNMLSSPFLANFLIYFC